MIYIVSIRDLHVSRISVNFVGNSFGMTTNELRIGNYVQIATKYRIFRLLVIRISEKTVRTSHQSGPSTIKIKNLQGIPLTQDVILNCGFSEVGFYDNVYHRGDYRIYLNKETSTGLLKYETGDCSFEIEVKHVHQLQNLCFALTGVELPVSTSDLPIILREKSRQSRIGDADQALQNFKKIR
ncbi:MAG: hypothetical protein HPZ83_13140 [Odoribacter sp.]|nr:hypothetical protein [Odoribacter sp.]